MDKKCVQAALMAQSASVEVREHVYFRYLLWATFGLSAVRFTGVSRVIDGADRSVCGTGACVKCGECVGASRRRGEDYVAAPLYYVVIKKLKV